MSALSFNRWAGPLVIEQIGGNCPCQADGSFYGFPFYFRARGGSWTLEVALPGDDPVCAMAPVYFAEGEDDTFGWMTASAAMLIIAEHWERFQKSEAHLAGYAYEMPRPLFMVSP